MNATIIGIIDHMFKDTVDTAETRALHEEVLNNCLEHYQDLVSRGMSETEAIDAVVESLKGMKEVIDEYPKKPTAAKKTEAVYETPDPGIGKTEEPAPKEETPTEYVYEADEVDTLRAELKGGDLEIGLSEDNRIHIRCEKMDQLVCNKNGQTLNVRLKDKEFSSKDNTDGMNGEFSLQSLLNFVGKTIEKVASGVITVSWDVTIEVPAKQFNEMVLNSRSGDITLKSILPDRLNAHTTSGDIIIEAAGSEAASRVDAGSMSGDVSFRGNAGKITLSSLSGDVEAQGNFEGVDLKSTSGKVELTGCATEAKLASVSGSITGDFRNTDVRSIDGRSTSGSVRIELAKGTESVHANMSSVSGSCSCDYPDAGNAAMVQINAKTVSGSVRIR